MRLRAMCVVVAAACSGAWGQTYIYNAIVAGMGDSSNGYSPVLGYPVYVGQGTMRGAFEFYLQDAPQFFRINSVLFSFDNQLPMGLPFRSQLYGYAGDGQISAADFVRTSLPVGTPPSIEIPGVYSLPLSNVNAITAAMGFGSSRHLGILITPTFGFTSLYGAQITISWTAIPAPGTALVLGLGMMRRRRRV